MVSPRKVVKTEKSQNTSIASLFDVCLIIFTSFKNNPCQHLQAAKYFRQIWLLNTIHTHAHTIRSFDTANIASLPRHLAVKKDCKYENSITSFYDINVAVFWKDLRKFNGHAYKTIQTKLRHQIECMLGEGGVKSMFSYSNSYSCSQTSNTHSKMSFMLWLFSLKCEWIHSFVNHGLFSGKSVLHPCSENSSCYFSSV